MSSINKICLKNYFVTSILSVLLGDGPEQADSVKPRFMCDSWYSWPLEWGLRSFSAPFPFACSPSHVALYACVGCVENVLQHLFWTQCTTACRFFVFYPLSRHDFSTSKRFSWIFMDHILYFQCNCSSHGSAVYASERGFHERQRHLRHSTSSRRPGIAPYTGSLAFKAPPVLPPANTFPPPPSSPTAPIPWQTGSTLVAGPQSQSHGGKHFPEKGGAE